MADATDVVKTAAKVANPWLGLAEAALPMIGNIFGANSSADVERQKMEQEQRQRDFENQMMESRRTAYQNMLKTGTETAGQGEAGFMGAVNQAPTSLEQAQKDILAGSAKGLQQGAGQMQANLAAQGIRGGQAGTLLNRGTGALSQDAQTNLTKQKLEDEQRRQSALLAYQAQKSAAGRTAQLSPAMY